MTDRRRFTGTCPTRHHIVIAYLWEEYPNWVPVHALINLRCPTALQAAAATFAPVSLPVTIAPKS
jgi:hypothetical protein